MYFSLSFFVYTYLFFFPELFESKLHHGTFPKILIPENKDILLHILNIVNMPYSSIYLITTFPQLSAKMLL